MERVAETSTSYSFDILPVPNNSLATPPVKPQIAPEHFVIHEKTADGRKNEAVGYIDKMKLDTETMKQLREMTRHQTVENARIMPDAHRGAGNCVGFTSHLREIVLPRFIGGDIGCGILTYNIGQQPNINLVEIDRQIKETIPMGSGTRNIWPTSVVTDNDISGMCKDALSQAYAFSLNYFNHFGTSLDDHIPEYSEKWLEERCAKVGVDCSEVMRSIGSLGGGNHFIEFNKATNNDIYVTVHSGSRTFGSAIFTYHQEKIDATRHFDYREFDAFMADIRQKGYKVPKVLKQFEDAYMERFENQKHADYLKGTEAYEYFFDMIFAQNIAKLNRRIMVREIMKFVNMQYDEKNVIESIHNYINFEDMILRKGAIAAHEGELCLIALNMRDGILICRGKGNEEWNNSTAHGAGRTIPRHNAHNKVSMREFKNSMKDICTSSVTIDTLDEAPQCYKDSSMIMELIEPSVDIMDRLLPILNVKAGN